MARTDELFAAIQAKDVARMRALLEEESSLATARDGEGVSALLRARYTLSRDVVEPIRSHVSELDAFEAAAFGDVDRLAEIIDARPAVVDERSGDGFTPLHLAAYFGKDDPSGCCSTTEPTRTPSGPGG